MLLNPGTVLGGRYEIAEKIGSGGMAMVYRGKDKKLDRYVTIKVLREEFRGDEEFIARFRSEARSAAKLSHPNIVRVYDVGEDENISYIVMEYIHGDTLKQAIKEKAPFDSRSTINVAIQIASALSQAHKSHIVHRDIKPQNILVGTDGVVKVTDFGIARAATASTMTTTADAAGSVHYFSPEQARGGYVDEKSDIYSLGITMFEMITGELPFQGNTSVAIALKHLNDELPDIRQFNPKCTRSLEGIIRKATMKKTDDRYADIDLMLADLIHAKEEIGDGTAAEDDHKKEVKAAAVGSAIGAAAGTAAGAAGAGRMSKRAEAAERIREEQAKHEQEEKNDSLEGKTKFADPTDVEYVRSHRKTDSAQDAPKEEEHKKHPRMDHRKKEESMLDKYNKKIKISKEDEYEGEFVEAEPVMQSKRPDKKRRNPRLEAEYDNEHDRKAERKVIAAAIVTAVVIIGIISAFGMKMLGGGFGFGGDRDIETPYFLGMTFEEAKAAADQMGIELVEEGRDYSAFFDEGEIFYQSVDEGTMISKKTKVGVKISLGLLSEEMPDVLGDSEKSATKKILSLVGVTPEIEYVFDSDEKPGVVLEQNPEPGAEINAHSTIRLKVSKGDKEEEVDVPNVEGYSLERAKRALEAAGLTVGSVSEAASSNVAEGKVITQTVKGGTSVSRGSTVNLVVSSGAAAEEPEPEAPEEQPLATGTKYFTVSAPSDASGPVSVRVVKNDADGSATVVEETRDASEFPISVSVTGKGGGTVTCFVNGAQQWAQNVNFGE